MTQTATTTGTDAHTGAPWAVDEVDACGWQILGPSNGFCCDIIANVLDTDVPEGAANARLIAAAPELLEVAHDAVWAFEGVLDAEDIDHNECAALIGRELCGAGACQESGCIVDKLRRAKAVVSKARGK